MANRLKSADYKIMEKKLNNKKFVSSLDFTLSLGNLKLPKSTAIFNLPAVKTCLNCADCSKFCYALSNQKRFPSCNYSREKNLSISKDKNFVSKFNNALKRSKAKTVRYHEAGDVYSAKYLLSLVKIANDNPQVYFYMYTKSTKLNYKNVPANFRVIDSTNKAKNLKNKAAVLTKENFKNAKKTIQSQYRRFFLCQGDCKKCNYCFNPKTKKVKVLFLEHSSTIKQNVIYQKQIDTIKSNFYSWSR